MTKLSKKTVCSPFDAVIIVGCNNGTPQDGINTIDCSEGMRCYLKDKVDWRILDGSKFFCLEDLQALRKHLQTSTELVQISLPLASHIFKNFSIGCYFPENVTVDLSEYPNIEAL
ncbi:hypothetical protein GCM10007916_10100 [Psychromonas marina]|uniref:Uncharacterized protein n=1 Tax=Psychromonas marina TaxID=88364 RepID=A0ABQ6DXR9_9GAMM|nr:hypothetical protein [Psychromonas marina]GLS89943.1 hypothetical protein GCM10007916_10100 [Psychromonas marina]